MALIDDIFGPIPPALIDEWGQSIVYYSADHQQGVADFSPRPYTPSSGQVSTFYFTFNIKAIILNISSRESGDLFQTTDLRVIIGADGISDRYPTHADIVQYTQGTGLTTTRKAKVIDIKTYRGEKPVMHVLTVRPE